MKNATFTIGRSRRHEHGVTLLMVAISIAVLLAIAALAIDLGVLYTARTSAQHAVDAAALAGVSTFVTNPTATQPAKAVDAVKGVLMANSVLGKQVDMSSVAALDRPGSGCPASVATPPFICVDTTNQRVTVSAGSINATSVEVYFAKVMGLTSVGVGAVATAEAGRGATGTYCLKPIFMPLSGDWTKCSSGQTIFDANGQLLSSLVGQQFYFWPKGSGGASKGKSDWIMTSSQDGLLDLTINPGGAGVRSGLGFDGCVDFKYKCGDTVDLKTGVTGGPVKQGVEDMIGDPPDTWKAVGQYCYQGNCNDIRDTSRSLATVVVWDCAASPSQPGNGQITVAGFSEVFIDRSTNKPYTDGSNNGISAHLISASLCGTGNSGGGGSGGSGQIAGVPIRLIQTPQ